jgi:hypothetical protein
MIRVLSKDSNKAASFFLRGFILFMIFATSGLGFHRTLFAAAPAKGQVSPNVVVEPKTRTFNNAASISIPASGNASPYPSNIVVSGVPAGEVITAVSVRLNSYSHTNPDDVDVLLVGPTTSQNAKIMSDVGGTPDATNLNITLDDNAASSLSDAGPLASGTFKPTDINDGADTFSAPAPAASGNTALSVFNGSSPNGTWSLYVVDDTALNSGSIGGGWTLIIQTGTSFTGGAITQTDSLSPPTPASPYPSTINVSGQGTSVGQVIVKINGWSHTEPRDVDMLLVGPTGANAIILSDIGSTPTISNVNLVLDDRSATPLPTAGTLVSGTYQPTNSGTGDTFPAPAPAPSGGSALSVFQGTNPNGTWSLYSVDDLGGDGGSIASWELIITAPPTIDRLDSYEATARADGRVSIKWNAGFDAENLGYNVYRDEGGQRVRVNKNVIAGSALQTRPGVSLSAGRTYTWHDRTARGSAPAQYWIEAISIKGQSTWHGPVVATTDNRSGDSFELETRSLTFDDINTEAGSVQGAPAPVYLDAASSSFASEATLAPAVAQSTLAGRAAVKIEVNKDGFYRVTQAQLVAAGLSPSTDPRTLQLYLDGAEQKILVNGEEDGVLGATDYLEFYGRGYNTVSTNRNVYWLVVGAQAGLRMKPVSVTGTPVTGAGFPYVVTRSDKSIYFSSLRNGDKENFFGAVVTGTPVDQTLTLQSVAAGAAGAATLEVHLQGVTQAAHSVKVLLNGAEVGLVAFDNQGTGIAQVSVPQSSLVEGTNTVSLAAQNGDNDVSLVDEISMTYLHGYTADNNALRFTAPGGQEVSLSGFSGADVRVIDITDVEKSGPVEVAGSVAQRAAGYGVTVAAPGEGMRTLFAFSSDQVKTPASVTANLPSSLATPANGADLLIITRRDLFSAITPLKNLRLSQGLKVTMVDVDDIFDEFNYGRKSSQAIRDFLSYASSSWKVKPRYVLFAGSASYDAKNYLGFGDFDLVPSQLIDTQQMEAASDDALADFDGDAVPDMAVGRLPVRNASEASALVTKLIGYEQSRPSQSVLLVSDSFIDYNFQAMSSQLKPLVPRGYRVDELARGQVADASTKKKLIGAISRGPRIVNYTGHGNVTNWNGDILTVADAGLLDNDRSLTMFVAMNCLNGYFNDPGTLSLAEALMKARGGAIAVFASSGMTPPDDQALMNQELYRLVFATGANRLRLGEATARAKAAIADRDVRRTWITFGDPSMYLK